MGRVVVWHSGSALVSINKVNLCRTRLVQGWVTVFTFQCGIFISLCNHPARSTQPGHPSVGRRNEYQPKDDDAVRLGSKGRYRSSSKSVWVAGKLCDPLVTHGPYLSTLEIRHYKALYKFTFFLCLLYRQFNIHSFLLSYTS